MAVEETPDWLVQLYEEQGASLHRLAVLLDAEEQSGRIVRSALLALHRRSHRLIDPAERVEFLQEHVVHLARAVRTAQAPIRLPVVTEPRQEEVLRTLSAMPPHLAEILTVSHYLSVFGPELAGIMRMSVRGSNQRLEIALDTLRAKVGEPTPGSQPGVIESLSQELTAALRSAARTVQAPGTDTLEGELQQLATQSHLTFGPRAVVALTIVALLAGILLAAFTRPTAVVADPPSPIAAAADSSQPETRLLPAVVRNVPLYYVGRQDGKLYRELRDLRATDNLIRSAIEALLTLVPLDSADYESSWPPGQLLEVRPEGKTLRVTLTADTYRDFASPVQMERARTQLVYTAAELLGEPELKVVFASDGDLPKQFADAAGYGKVGLNPMPGVWISSPKNQAQLPAGSLVIMGTVKPGIGEPIVTITDVDSDKVVMQTSAQTSTGVNSEGWRVWTVNATLPAGNFDLRATVGDAETRSSENKIIKVG